MAIDIDPLYALPAPTKEREEYRDIFVRKRAAIQYSYQHPSGKTFGTIATDIAECRRRRDLWLAAANLRSAR